MRLSDRLVGVCLFALFAACSGSSAQEEPPGAEATEGGEAEPAAVEPEAPAEPPQPAQPDPEPEPESPAAAVNPQQDQMQAPPFAAIVIHDVKDYDAWKAVFDGHADTRKQAGLLGEGVMRGVDKEQTVVVYAPAMEAETLQSFFASEEMKARMKEAGVKGKPSVLIFSTQGADMAPPGDSPRYGAILRYEVADFEAFKAAVEGQADARREAGVVGYGLGQSVEEDTVAMLYLQADDPKALKSYLEAKETKQAMKEAGARGQPKRTIVQETAMTMYAP